MAVEVHAVDQLALVDLADRGRQAPPLVGEGLGGGHLSAEAEPLHATRLGQGGQPHVEGGVVLPPEVPVVRTDVAAPPLGVLGLVPHVERREEHHPQAPGLRLLEGQDQGGLGGAGSGMAADLVAVARVHAVDGLQAHAGGPSLGDAVQFLAVVVVRQTGVEPQDHAPGLRHQGPVLGPPHEGQGEREGQDGDEGEEATDHAEGLHSPA